ncbi:hypothetical protein MOP88_03250 [Sphingomonas sp. WKB10]|nr:hypothetical protein [Sphingomonas sp. WKB10]
MVINEESIISALETAPPWALLALTAPRQSLREDAAHEVAHHLIAALSRLPRAPAGQLSLPL